MLTHSTSVLSCLWVFVSISRHTFVVVLSRHGAILGSNALPLFKYMANAMKVCEPVSSDSSLDRHGLTLHSQMTHLSLHVGSCHDTARDVHFAETRLQRMMLVFCYWGRRNDVDLFRTFDLIVAGIGSNFRSNREVLCIPASISNRSVFVLCPSMIMSCITGLRRVRRRCIEHANRKAAVIERSAFRHVVPCLHGNHQSA